MVAAWLGTLRSPSCSSFSTTSMHIALIYLLSQFRLFIHVFQQCQCVRSPTRCSSQTCAAACSLAKVLRTGCLRCLRWEASQRSHCSLDGQGGMAESVAGESLPTPFSSSLRWLTATHRLHQGHCHLAFSASSRQIQHASKMERLPLGCSRVMGIARTR
jgi:hypothetical protein